MLPDKNGETLIKGDFVLWNGEECEVVYVDVLLRLISIAHTQGFAPVKPGDVVKVEKTKL